MIDNHFAAKKGQQWCHATTQGTTNLARTRTPSDWQQTSNEQLDRACSLSAAKTRAAACPSQCPRLQPQVSERRTQASKHTWKTHMHNTVLLCFQRCDQLAALRGLATSVDACECRHRELGRRARSKLTFKQNKRATSRRH